MCQCMFSATTSLTKPRLTLSEPNRQQQGEFQWMVGKISICVFNYMHKIM